jgi:hypothetical protein
VLDCARAEKLLSDEHFSVDGTKIRAWASQALFVGKDGSDDVGDGSNFHAQKRSNDTHASTTDPDARLFKKSRGSEAHLAYLGHALTENRHGFAVMATLEHAIGTAEREAALTMMDETPAKDQDPASTRRRTGADKHYDTAEFVAEWRARNITPHVAQNTHRPGGIAPLMHAPLDMRNTRLARPSGRWPRRIHAGSKTWSTMRRAMVRGLERMKAQHQMEIMGGNLLQWVNFTG